MNAINAINTIRTVMGKVTIIILTVNVWSGRKHLKAEDIGLREGEIPPEALISLGSKKIYDPEALAAFQRLKKRAERACLKLGTRFIGGFAIPHEHVVAVIEELETIRKEYAEMLGEFLDNYEATLEEWLQGLPPDLLRYREVIRSAAEPREVVAGRFGFRFDPVIVQPADVPGDLEHTVRGLGDGVFSEVAQIARELEASFTGKAKLTRRALGTFARVRDKLATLSFVDPRIDPIVDTIDDWVGRLPKTGPIDGGLFNEGFGLAALLADPQKMHAHAVARAQVLDGVIEEDEDEDIAALPEPAQADPVDPQPEPIVAHDPDMDAPAEEAPERITPTHAEPQIKAPTASVPTPALDLDYAGLFDDLDTPATASAEPPTEAPAATPSASAEDAEPEPETEVTLAEDEGFYF